MKYELIAKNIKRIRIDQGLSKGDVAHALRVSTPEVVRIEGGINTIDINSLLPLSKVLRVPISKILEGYEAKGNSFKPKIINRHETPRR